MSDIVQSPPPDFDPTQRNPAEIAKERAVDVIARPLRQRLTGEAPLSAPPVVTIWGAGATIPCGIPGGFYLMQRMQKDLDAVRDTNAYRSNVSTLEAAPSASLHPASPDAPTSRDVNGAPHDRPPVANPVFEEVLAGYGKLYGTESLHRWLSQFIPHGSSRTPRVFPSFAHDFVAHLASSGALRCFISVNFDEVLESALEDELGRDRVMVVASSSEFERLKGHPREEWATVLRCPEPSCIVLKPHGSISRSMTLRHLPDLVGRFEPEKRVVLREALRGALPVLVGFGCYNEDFRLLLAEAFAEGLTSDLLVVDPHPDAVVRNLTGSRGSREVLPFEGTADEFFGALETKLWPPKGTVVTTLARQKPTRHRIRAHFFRLFERRLTKLSEEASYRERHRRIERIPEWWFDLRLYELELLIHLLKTRGLFIDVVATYCRRIDASYRKCLEWVQQGKIQGLQSDLRPTSVFDRLLGQLVDNASVHGPATPIGLGSHWCYIKWPEVAAPITRGDLESVLNDTCDKVATAYKDFLVDAMKSEEFGEHESEDFYGSAMEDLLVGLKTDLNELWKDFDVDVSSRTLTGPIRFKKPRSLPSRVEFDDQTAQLLLKKWDTVRLATVSAEWLTRFLAKGFPEGAGRTLIVVSNLEMFKLLPRAGPSGEQLFHYWQMVRSLRTVLDALPRCGVSRLAWYGRRNLENHMTIASNETTILGAIHFSRRGRSTSVSPVFLDDSDDLGDLVRYFDNTLRYERFLSTDDEDSGKLFDVTVEEGSVTWGETSRLGFVQSLVGHLDALQGH